MMRYCFLVVALVTVCVFAEDERYARSLQGMQGLRLICDTEAKLQVVHTYENHPDYDFLKITKILGDEIEVLVTADEVVDFKSVLANHGIVYEIFVENVADAIDKDYAANELARSMALLSSESSTPFSFFPRYDDIERYLSVLEASYDSVTLFTIGNSFEGRPTYGVKISSGPGEKPAILIDAGIHAREWIAPTTALHTIHQLVTNETNNDLLRKIDWYIIPSLNPDGYEFSHLSRGNRMWRKTRSFNPAIPNCHGVDANRNFDIAWNTVGTSSPCSTTYAGTKPFSEPESANLRDFIQANVKSIKLYLSLHSYAQMFLHPWGYTQELPKNEPELRTVGLGAAEALTAVSGTKYRVGSTSHVIYEASGVSVDWAAASGVPFGYTIELPAAGASMGFNPDPDQIKPVGIETFEAIRFFAQYIEKKHA